MNKKRKTKKTKLKNNKKKKTIRKLDFPENDKAKLHILYILFLYFCNFFHFLYIDLVKRGENFQTIL